MRVEDLLRELEKYDPNAVVLRPGYGTGVPSRTKYEVRDVYDTFDGPVIS